MDDENLQSKSLKTILQKHKDLTAIRFSMSPYREQERMTNMPLYGASVCFTD